MSDIGIYYIKSKVDGKLYIGKSISIFQRIKDHFKRLKSNSHCNKHLQSSYNLNSIDNFEFGIFIYCTIEDLDFNEDLFIEKYQTLNDAFGFNFKGGGIGGKHVQATKDAIRNGHSKQSKSVFAYDMLGVFIKQWSSISLCAQELKVNPCDVRRTIQEKQRFCKGFVLNNKKEFRLRSIALIGRPPRNN